jgi:hypothetical protein
MAIKRDNHFKYEVFRFITPILVTLCLAILSAIWRSADEMQKDIVLLKVDVATLKAHSNGGN